MATERVPFKRKRPTQASPRMQQLIDGEITVEDLDDEELRRGQLRDKNGEFKGRPPLLVPREFYEAITREMLERGNATMRSHMEASIGVIAELMVNKRTPARERLAAAQYMLERTAGKIPEKQIVQASISKWEKVLDEVTFDADFEHLVPEQRKGETEDADSE